MNRILLFCAVVLSMWLPETLGAQTVTPTYVFTNNFGPIRIAWVTVTPLCPQFVNGAWTGDRPFNFPVYLNPSLTNGILTISSNLANGYSYRVAWNDGYSTHTVTNLFGTTVSGPVLGFNYNGIYVNGPAMAGGLFAYFSPVVTNIQSLATLVTNTDGTVIVTASTNSDGAVVYTLESTGAGGVTPNVATTNNSAPQIYSGPQQFTNSQNSFAGYLLNPVVTNAAGNVATLHLAGNAATGGVDNTLQSTPAGMVMGNVSVTSITGIGSGLTGLNAASLTGTMAAGVNLSPAFSSISGQVGTQIGSQIASSVPLYTNSLANTNDQRTLTMGNGLSVFTGALNGTSTNVSGTLTNSTTGNASTATTALNAASGGNIITNTILNEAFLDGTYVVNGVQYQTNQWSVIQAALDRMPQYTTKTRAGGGTLNLQVGVYDLTNTIVLTNNNVMTWVIIGQGNNSTAIKANGNYEVIHMDSISTNDSQLNLDLYRLAVVNATNCQTNLIYTAHESKNHFFDCQFTDYAAWTNNGNGSPGGSLGVQPGLSGNTPTYPAGLIAIYDAGSQGDRYLVELCTFNALADGMLNQSDHTELWQNDFSVISQWQSNGVVIYGNSWTNKSIFSTGFCVASLAGIKPVQNWFPYYYDDGLIGPAGNVIEHEAAYEGGQAAVATYNNGTVNVNGHTPALQDDVNGADDGYIFWGTNSSGVWTNSGAFTAGTGAIVGFQGSTWGSWTTDGNATAIDGIDPITGFFDGNGSELTSLNASALVSGTVPIARLTNMPPASISTNLSKDIEFIGSGSATGSGVWTNKVTSLNVGVGGVTNAGSLVLAGAFSAGSSVGSLYIDANGTVGTNTPAGGAVPNVLITNNAGSTTGPWTNNSGIRVVSSTLDITNGSLNASNATVSAKLTAGNLVLIGAPSAGSSVGSLYVDSTGKVGTNTVGGVSTVTNLSTIVITNSGTLTFVQNTNIGTPGGTAYSPNIWDYNNSGDTNPFLAAYAQSDGAGNFTNRLLKLRGFDVPLVQAGVTNVALVASTTQGIIFLHPMPNTNYVPVVVLNGVTIPGQFASGLTTNGFTENMTALTFTGPMLWTVTGFTK